jgi:hypothetical protein
MKKVSDTETVVFPEDENNSMYVEYLEWVESGNTAEYLPSPEEALEIEASKE